MQSYKHRAVLQPDQTSALRAMLHPKQGTLQPCAQNNDPISPCDRRRCCSPPPFQLMDAGLCFNPQQKCRKHAFVEGDFETKVTVVGDARHFHFLSVTRRLIQGRHKAPREHRSFQIKAGETGNISACAKLIAIAICRPNERQGNLSAPAQRANPNTC